MKQLLKLSFLLAGLSFFTACEDDNDEIQPDGYDVPTTYFFENVDYEGQIIRQDMLEEMTAYMKTGNEGATLDAEVLKAMYGHTEGTNNFEQANLNASDKNLRSKTFPNGNVPELFEGFMDAIAVASQSNVPGDLGQAGVVTSTNDPSKKYLLNENGVEYTQLIEKGLMGACFLYQGSIVYLGDIAQDDNETVEPGKGTEMEHHFDEGFGYFGVPTDFPNNKDGIRFWGKYCNSRDELLGTNETMMDNFLLGRAAVSNDDAETRDEAISILTDTWELISASTAIHYLNTARSEANFGDDAIRCHALSEAVAFLYNTLFVPESKMTQTKLDELFELIGGSSEWNELNFYTPSRAELGQAVDEISTIYQLDDSKNDL